jgi:hypothetical protein
MVDMGVFLALRTKDTPPTSFSRQFPESRTEAFPSINDIILNAILHLQNGNSQTWSV